jgi:hypothetical protein
VQSTCQRHVKHEKFSESNEIIKIIGFMKLFTNSGLQSKFHAYADIWDILPTPGVLHPIYGAKQRQSSPRRKAGAGAFVTAIAKSFFLIIPSPLVGKG